MVNTQGLTKRSTYEEVMREVQLDKFKDLIKYPDRTATFVLEAPALLALDPENEEQMIAFEKRRRAEAARKAEVEEVAQARGVSKAELEALTKPVRSGPLLEPGDDSFETRRMENEMAQSMSVYESATARAANVERVRDMLRRDHQMASRSDPIARLVDDDAQFYDISTPPNEERSLSIPSVPQPLARMGKKVARGVLIDSPRALGSLAIRAAPPTVDTLAEAARLTAVYGPGVARSTMAAAGYSAQALGLVARGLASGGQAAGQAAVASAHLLASTVPVSHRGKDFQTANGVQFAGRLVRHTAAGLY
jgi:hypothetical protein